MLELPAFAKINWTLRVVGRRPDGYHEICTIFQTVSLADRLIFKANDYLSLSCTDESIPTDERNLVWRAADALQRHFGVSSGAHIHLEKSIPSPGGLGGGSADAAVALLALAHLWQIETTKRELTEIGAKLGADVPFFITGGTAVGTGLGAEIESLPDIPKKLLLIATPRENVSTADAYRALNAPPLTNENAKSILKICRSEAQTGDFLQTAHNDFEKVIFRQKPEIAKAKNELLRLGAQPALMSGSGASVFGVFDNEETRQTAFARLSENETQWRVFSCETVSREEYRKSFKPCWNLLKDLS